MENSGNHFVLNKQGLTPIFHANDSALPVSVKRVAQILSSISKKLVWELIDKLA
jgi:hypothetical protein